uniref:NADH-ubiquinone oxidoreductase chain 2 n=1 Tax=Cipangopaludina ussuriensis TaxID=2023715 RepID=A0A222YUN0_CIPUS|nr:NADH dehydrogenase subunit 2 [Cipangopaludina ussuriensis]ASR74850.1 NADH dehydrogenase subunit 2 [Cipangopaludina ussuriensis]
MLGMSFNYLFWLMMVFGTIFSISSLHWLGMWVGLELNLIGFLPILVCSKSMKESESGTKYFIVQAMGSSFLMFGSLILFSFTFSWEILNMLSFKYFLSSIVFLMSGLFMKIGMFPFHFWFPSVMSGLPWLSCLLLITWQKLAPIFLISVLMEIINVMWVLLMVCVMSSMSALVGGFGGINQSQIRSLLAYSSIGHMGWIILSLCQSCYNMKIYFFIYIVISLCLFMVLWYNNIVLMLGMNSFVKHLFIDFSLILLFLSLGGLPPLLGFIAKLNVFISIFDLYMYWFILLLILGSIMSLFYYLSLLFVFFINVFNKITYKEIFKSYNMISLVLFINFLGGLMMLMFDFFEFI